MVKELQGLYQTMYRVWKIRFPYKTHGVYIFFGAEQGAIAEAGKLQKKLKHPYAPKITEITKAFE